MYANFFVSRPNSSTVSGVVTPIRPCMAPIENLKYQNLHGKLDFAMKTQYVRAELLSQLFMAVMSLNVLHQTV